MNAPIRYAASAAVAAFATLSWTSSSFAASTADPASTAAGIDADELTTSDDAAPSAAVSSPSVGRTHAERATKNSEAGAGLVLSGLITFGFAYVPSVMIAGEGNVTADRRLFVPIAGPWLDMHDRPACGPIGPSCDSESVNQALLVVDGVLQGLAVVEVLAGLATLAQDDSSEAVKPKNTGLHVTPAQFGAGGYGLATFGSF